MKTDVAGNYVAVADCCAVVAQLSPISLGIDRTRAALVSAMTLVSAVSASVTIAVWTFAYAPAAAVF